MAGGQLILDNINNINRAGGAATRHYIRRRACVGIRPAARVRGDRPARARVMSAARERRGALIANINGSLALSDCHNEDMRLGVCAAK